MSEANADADSTATDADPKPAKRGRGRPRIYARDDQGNPIRPPGVVQPKKKASTELEASFDWADDSLNFEDGARPKRATRGKVPSRFKDAILSEREQERQEEEAESTPVLKGRRGRPPKYAERPPSPENNGNPDVTVNIAVKDKSCAQHLDLMGVYILYYCRKCAFSSKQMADITDHIKAGEHLHQPIEALEGVVMEDQTVETFVSEPLVSEALTDVAQEDLQNIVAKDKIVRTGGRFVKVDEHSYAEVTVEKKGAPGAGGDAAGASEDTVQEMDDEQEDEAVAETTEQDGDAGEELEVGNVPVSQRIDAGEMSDDSAADPDFDGGEAKELEADSDHEMESDGDNTSPQPSKLKKRGRKRKLSDTDSEFSLTMNDENFAENSDLEEDPMIPRRYTCPQCPYIVLYSFNDFKEHRRCHKNAVDSSLHCYICQLADRRRVMAGEKWGRIKTHLAAFHNIDFQLNCPKCPAQLSQHSLFVRHYKSHLHSCKYDFCSYDTAIEEDMRLHTKCHSETNPRNFRCPLCSFMSKKRPYRWPIIHYHLVTKHGAVKANFTCNVCDAGFFDSHTYINHKNTCGRDEFTNCKLCREDIPKASLVRHAVWHVQKDEGVIPPDAKFEYKTYPRVEKENFIVEAQGPETAELNEQTNEENKNETSSEAAHQPGTKDSKTVAEESIPQVQSQDATSNEEEATPGSETQENEDVETETVATQPADDQNETNDETANETTDKTPNTMPNEMPIDAPNETPNETPIDGVEEVWRCIEHELTFESQAALTMHYVRDHWGFSQERLLEARREADRRMKDQEKRFPTVEDNDVMRRVDQVRRSVKFGLNERCQYCYKTFASVPRLLRHLSRCHTEEKLKPMACPTCGKAFKNRVQLRNHYRVVHEGVKRRKPEVPYKPRKRLFICELCGYTTPENVRLRNHHLSAHAGVMPYACEICQYKTNENSDLKRHMAKHQGRKRHTCDYCDYKTDQRWLLVNHCIRQHNVQLPKHTRDTRGMTFSSRKKVDQQQPQIEQVIVEGGDEISLETLENLVQLQAVQNGEEVTIWMTTPEEYEAATTGMKKGDEEVLAVESLQDAGEGETPEVVYVTEQEQDKDGSEVQQIVYVREDGTIVTPEELMTMTVQGEEYGEQVEHQTLIIEPQTLQVQEVEETEEGQSIVIQES